MYSRLIVVIYDFNLITYSLLHVIPNYPSPDTHKCRLLYEQILSDDSVKHAFNGIKSSPSLAK